MKYIYILFILIASFSCSKNKDEIIIDLEKSSKELLYSNIVDHIDYLVLNTNNTCLLSGISKLLIDNDTLIIQDTKHEGVFVFTMHGNFIKQINYIGEGPEEYHKDNAVAIDTTSNHIYIYDMMNSKINQYTYDGDFISSKKTDYFIRDLAITNNKLLMIQPCINKAYKKSGLWIASQNNEIIKSFFNYDNTENQDFEYISTYTTQTTHGTYYYDRNYDNIYIINNDSCQKLLSIDLKQKIPYSTRRNSAPPANALMSKGIMNTFCVSSKYIIINYFIFGNKNNSSIWTIIETKTNNVSIYKNIIDDIDRKTFPNNEIFYINDTTWCRMVETQENDCNTLLQFIHLK